MTFSAAGTGTSIGTPRRITRWVYATLALIPAVGLAMQLILVFSGAFGTSRSPGARLLFLLSFFTIQSNILVLIVAILLALRPGRDGPVWRVVRLDSLLGITITGIIYATILAASSPLEGLALTSSVLLHYVCPWLFLLAWIVLGPRPRISWWTVLAAFVWPLLWIGYTLLHGALTGWYPYSFLDASQLGYPVVLRNTAVILLFAGALAVVFRLLDRLPEFLR